MYTLLIHTVHKIISFITVMHKACDIRFIYWVPGYDLLEKYILDQARWVKEPEVI